MGRDDCRVSTRRAFISIQSYPQALFVISVRQQAAKKIDSYIHSLGIARRSNVGRQNDDTHTTIALRATRRVFSFMMKFRIKLSFVLCKSRVMSCCVSCLHSEMERGMVETLRRRCFMIIGYTETTASVRCTIKCSLLCLCGASYAYSKSRFSFRRVMCLCSRART